MVTAARNEKQLGFYQLIRGKVRVCL